MAKGLQLHRQFSNFIHGVSTELPRVTIPVAMKKNIKKIKTKALEENQAFTLRDKQKGNKKVPLITCKHSKLNHHLNQSYNKFSEVPLASKGWTHYKSAGDYFTINPFRSNPVLFSDNDKLSFESYQLDGRIIDVLKKLGIEHPTRIQNACIPKAMLNQNILCCGQTGSGKTLAYLLPIIDKLLYYSANKQTLVDRSEPNSPLSLVVAPSRELALQVWDVANEICGALGVNVKLTLGGETTKKFLTNPEFDFDVDMLISTPGVLKKLISSTVYKVSQIKHVVLDEIDTMLDDSFLNFIEFLFRNLISSQGFDTNDDSPKIFGTQLMFIGATLPQGFAQSLEKFVDVDNLVNVSPHNLLHYMLPHISQKFLRVKASDKPHKVLQFAAKASKRNFATMIFTTDSKTCEWLSRFLEENNVENIALFGYLSHQMRLGRIEAFKAGACPILTCTDIASRGIDTTMLHYILNYDFPAHMSDYIHRIGRLGRVGSSAPGHAVNFICKLWEVELIKEIEYCFRKNIQLSKVDANIKKKVLEKYNDPSDTVFED